MSTQWFCMLNGKECGPLPLPLLHKLAEQGKLLPDDWVRKDSNAPWIAAREINGTIFSAAQLSTVKAVSEEPRSFVPAPFTPVEIETEYRKPRLLISGFLGSAFLLFAGVGGLLREFGWPTARMRSRFLEG